MVVYSVGQNEFLEGTAEIGTKKREGTGEGWRYTKCNASVFATLTQRGTYVLYDPYVPYQYPNILSYDLLLLPIYDSLLTLLYPIQTS